MKKVFQIAAIILAFVATTSTNVTAQTAAQNKAYWENEANKAIAQADRVINNLNQKTNTFSQQELQMMRSNDPRVQQQFQQLAAAKRQRMDAAQKQYEAHYNKQWSQSFNTFNTPQPKYYVRNAAGQYIPVY
jgi:hypothetical protein